MLISIFFIYLSCFTSSIFLFSEKEREREKEQKQEKGKRRETKNMFALKHLLK